ncbi:MAG: hypothetical protein IPK57_06315 [Chitinophagaceae bacterium]|nr:hypothetical protein [Chitinophagaceae bacterium]
MTNGVTTAVLNLNKTDGFFGSEFYKMLYHPMQRKWNRLYAILVWADR